jgi:hypothetical protein
MRRVLSRYLDVSLHRVGQAAGLKSYTSPAELLLATCLSGTGQECRRNGLG